MSTLVLRVLVGFVALAVIGSSTSWLRGETMSTHRAVADDSRMRLVVDAAQHRAEPGHTLREMVAAKVAICRLEVRRADVVEGPVEDEALPNRFGLVLQPALDDTDRTQFRGCLEDWNVDQLIVDVVTMTQLDDV